MGVVAAVEVVVVATKFEDPAAIPASHPQVVYSVIR